MGEEMRNIFLDRPSIESLSVKKPMIEDKYADAYFAWKNDPSEPNRDKLLHSLSPLIANNVQSISGGDYNYLTMKGKILAMKSMDQYDPGRSALATFLSNQLLPLRRLSRNQTNILNIPERAVMESKNLENAEVELEDELGRAPTTSELADKLKMSSKRIEKIRKSGYALNTGLSAPNRDTESDFNAPAVQRNIPEKYLHEYVLSAVESDPVLAYIYENDHQLNGRQRLTTEALASKLRLSNGAISQKRNKLFEIVNKAEKGIFG